MLSVRSDVMEMASWEDVSGARMQHRLEGV